MATEVPVFDAHARVDALGTDDLETLAFFGTAGLVTSAHDGFPGPRAEDLEAHLDAIEATVPRLRAAGITGYVALGVHPARIPWLGLDAVLARLPERLGRPEAVAVGEVGLFEGGEREEGVFGRQIDLARDLRLPLVVTLPVRHRARVLKRTLALLRDREVPPEGALLVRADAASVATIRGVGYRVALGGMEAEAIAELVARHGPEGLLLASEVGDGPSDPVALARTVDRLEAAGLSRAVVRRVARENAEGFYGVTLPARPDGD